MGPRRVTAVSVVAVSVSVDVNPGDGSVDIDDSELEEMFSDELRAILTQNLDDPDAIDPHVSVTTTVTSTPL